MVTAENQSTVSSAGPKVWYESDDASTSGNTALQQIREYSAANGIITSDHDEADVRHYNTIPFLFGDIWEMATADVPIITSVHGLYRSWASPARLLREGDFTRLRRRLTDRFSAFLPDALVFTTHAARRASESAGIPSDRTHVIPLGYDRDRYRDTTPTETDEPFFLCVTAHDHPRKNIPTMLETMRRSDYRFVCAGSAWPNYETPSNADIVGYIPESDLVDYYNRATALYLPSLFEGFGLPLVEAMACGTAVVTSDHGAMAEVSGEAGIWVPARDVNAHLDAFHRLSDDPQWRREREAAARDRASEFSWERTAKAYTQLYRTVVSA